MDESSWPRCLSALASASSLERFVRELSRQARLRFVTLQAHARIDALVETAGYFGEREKYAAYLKATWRARRPMEFALDRFGAESLFTIWPHRTIGPALRADYRDVSGCEPPDGEKEAMIIITSAQALGILYVLEGSALGARILTPRASALGMGAKFGASHLSLQVSTPGAWKMFLAVLEAAEFDRTQEEVCIEAALDTFARFERAYAAATTAFA